MYKQTQRIRDIINNPRIQYTLLKNQGLWWQLCSSLDVIDDSDLAIAVYSDGKFGSSDGAKYLAVYEVEKVKVKAALTLLGGR